MAQMCCAQMGYYCLSSSSDENSRSRGGDACGASFEETLSQNQYHLNNNNNNNSSMMISSDIGCYHTDQSIIFIRNAWPVVILWYGALLIFLYATDSGRNARGYACVKLGRCLLRLFPRFVREKLRSWSFCWCSHSPMDDLAERILAREVEIRNRMRSQAVAAMHARQRLLEIQTAHQHRQRRSLGENLRTTPLRNPFGVRNNDANSNPNALGNSDNNTDDYRLILRTKRYRAERDTETDNDDNAARASLNPLEHSEISRNDDDSGDISLFGLNSEEMVCTICLGAIQDNDRVGDIPCEHIFHVDCLKQVTFTYIGSSVFLFYVFSMPF